jgi:uroporphyrinogen-III decarboxylase
MTGKERVHAAIARKPVDRVPLGFYVVDHDIISAVIGRPTLVRNKVEMKLALAAGRRDEVADSFKKDTVEFYRKIDCADIIIPKEAAYLPPKNYKPDPLRSLGDDKYEDGKGRVFQAARNANDIVCIHDPAPKKVYTMKDFEGPNDPKAPDESIFEAVDYLCRELGSERYISAMPPFSAMAMLGDFQEAMMNFAMEPEMIHAAHRRSTERHNKLAKYYFRPGMTGAHISHDVAGTNGPYISPTMFRELCLPYIKERVACLKQYTDQVNLHNCGNNIPLMDMFIEAGIDCYQSLQTTAGMEIGLLRERFGHSMCFWGGVAVEALIAGTTDDVRKEVRNAFQRAGDGRGFILGPSHSIAFGTKYDNFMAMLDEYVKLRDRA